MKSDSLFNVLFSTMACLFSVAAYSENLQLQILSATVKDQKIAGSAITLQKNGAQSVVGVTDEQGQVSLNSTFTDTADSLLIVKKNVTIQHPPSLLK